MNDLTRLDQLLHLTGWTQARAAVRLGISRPSLSMILAGKRQPSPLVADRLADLAAALTVEAAPVLAELAVRHAS